MARPEKWLVEFTLDRGMSDLEGRTTVLRKSGQKIWAPASAVGPTCDSSAIGPYSVLLGSLEKSRPTVDLAGFRHIMVNL